MKRLKTNSVAEWLSLCFASSNVSWNSWWTKKGKWSGIIFFFLAWKKKNLISNWKKPSFLVWRACLFSALHCGAGEGSCLLAVPPPWCGSGCPNQKTQETHRAARAPHQRISQQYSYFSPDSLRCWDLGVHGGRAEQRGLKSMLNTLHRIAII